MKITKASVFLTGFYVALLIWWLTINLFNVRDTPFNIAFAFAYGLIPIIGGLTGLMSSDKWGLFKSAMGKALFFLSIGLITWGMGEMIWSYYNFVLKIEIPYPSAADGFFLISWPLWIIGVYYLSRATGARFGLKHSTGKAILFIFPIIAIVASYYLLIVVARDGVISSWEGASKVFFDLAYPILDVVILIEAMLIYGLSMRYLGGRYKWAVLITLSGFIFNYMADFAFSYTTTVGTFFNGNWVDLVFTTAVFVLSFGINSLSMNQL